MAGSSFAMTAYQVTQDALHRTDMPQLLPSHRIRRQRQILGILCQQWVGLAQDVSAGAGPGILPWLGGQPRGHGITLDVPAAAQQMHTPPHGGTLEAPLKDMPDEAMPLRAWG